MPIPPPDGDRAHPLAATSALLRYLHEKVRSEIAGLSDDVLAWVPCEGANSIAALVVHMLGSEAETLEAIAGHAAPRDRDSEFAPSVSGAELMKRLDDADALLRRVVATAPDLGLVVPLPTLSPDEKRPSMTWLIAIYGHAREHFGQLLLTKQLAESAAG